MLDSLTARARASRTARPRMALLGGVVALPLLLAGCVADPGPKEAPVSGQEVPAAQPDASKESPAAPSSGSAGTATFTVGDRAFAVELTLCGVYADATEVLLAGAASENGGSAHGFLEGDLVPFGSELNGEFRIDIGADGQLQSSDEFLALGYASGSPVTLSEEDGGYVIRSGAWNEKGDNLGQGSLVFACS